MEPVSTLANFPSRLFSTLPQHPVIFLKHKYQIMLQNLGQLPNPFNENQIPFVLGWQMSLNCSDDFHLSYKLYRSHSMLYESCYWYLLCASTTSCLLVPWVCLSLGFACPFTWSSLLTIPNFYFCSILSGWFCPLGLSNAIPLNKLFSDYLWFYLPCQMSTALKKKKKRKANYILFISKSAVPPC